ncbi:TPA: hypothetical protein OW286_002547 [Citrobacter freundii]|uniref:hypothetical protein n=1 Tax=Citrobacter meridianamericanus TaxID=2894201 RepID=UPI002287C224|nr:hypothetical protein [Citrobacter freundii]
MVNKKMRNPNHFHDEHYQCSGCGIDYEYDEVRDTWKCPDPDCNDYIEIYAEDANGTRARFLRKEAKEVEVGDLVKPLGGIITDFNEVYAIYPLKNGKLGFNLKEIGQRTFSVDDCITCRNGGAW